MKLIDLDTDKEYLLDGKYKVEPIVHCKECKYWNDWQAHTYCGRFDEYDFMPSDGYCSYGRRKDETD